MKNNLNQDKLTITEHIFVFFGEFLVEISVSIIFSSLIGSFIWFGAWGVFILVLIIALTYGIFRKNKL